MQLLAGCRADERRQIAGHQQPVGALLIEERVQLLPLAEQGFELAEFAFPCVDGLGCVRVRTNLYSVPAAVGVLRGLRRIEAQHVGQNAFGVNRGDCFFAGVVAGVS